MENKPGNGYDSPFGNGQGAVSSSGPASGSHDFVADPQSHAPATGGRDFTKESIPQKAGACSPNPDSVPAGGPSPFPQVDPAAGSDLDTATSPRKPFTLKGA